MFKPLNLSNEQFKEIVQRDLENPVCMCILKKAKLFYQKKHLKFLSRISRIAFRKCKYERIPSVIF